MFSLFRVSSLPHSAKPSTPISYKVTKILSFIKIKTHNTTVCTKQKSDILPFTQNTRPISIIENLIYSILSFSLAGFLK